MSTKPRIYLCVLLLALGTSRSWASQCRPLLIAQALSGATTLLKRCQTPSTPYLTELCDYSWMPPHLRTDVILMLSFIHQIGKINESIAADFLRVVKRDQPSSIIELGAGSGDVTHFLAEQMPQRRTRYLATDLYPQTEVFARRHPDAYSIGVEYVEHSVSFANFDAEITVGPGDLVFSVGVSHHLDDASWIEHLRRLDQARVRTSLVYDMHDRSIYNLIFAVGVLFPTLAVPYGARDISPWERVRMAVLDMPMLLPLVAWDSSVSALRQRRLKAWQELLERAGVPYQVSLRNVGDRFDLLKVIEFRRVQK